MRFILYAAFSFFCFSAWAQRVDPYAFAVKTSFIKGESHTYEVNELFKTNNQFFIKKLSSEVKSTVNFQVVDTAAGGYWLRYTINVNSVDQSRDSSAFIMAYLMDGIDLMIYARDGSFYLDTAVYFEAKQSVANDLDSILSEQLFGKKTTQYLHYLQSELREDAGLGTLLGPLMLYEAYYSSSVYKKFRINEAGITANVLHKPLFDGLIEKQWVSTMKDSTVKLNYVFTGAPVAAANYFKSAYEKYFAINNIKKRKHFFPPEINYLVDYNFQIKPGKSFPSYLIRKNVSEYGMRSVSKIEMKEVMAASD